MDLSDGSDVEAEVDLDQNAENALLGSDDEEAAQYTHTEYSEYDDNNHNLQGEEGDVLELELNDVDGLEFEDDVHHLSANGNSGLPPVHIRSTAMSSYNYSSQESMNHLPVQPSESEDYNYEGDDNYGAIEEDIEDEDEEDDERNTRSRFLSERNPKSTVGSSVAASSFGNPIQTLGNQAAQKNWNHPHHPTEQRQRPRFPPNRHSLLGDGPRQGFNQFNRPRGQRFHGPGPGSMSNPQVVQFQGRIFTDFNNPLRGPLPPQLRGPGIQAPNAMKHRPQGPQNMNGSQRHQNPRFQNRLPGNPNMRPRQHPGGPGNQWRQNRPQRHPFPPGMHMNRPQRHPGQNPFMQPLPGPPNMFPHHPDQPFLNVGGGGIRPEVSGQFNPMPQPPHGPLPFSGNGMSQPIRLQQPSFPNEVQIQQAAGFSPPNTFFSPSGLPQPHLQQPFLPDHRGPHPRPSGFWPHSVPETHVNPNWMGQNALHQNQNFIPPGMNLNIQFGGQSQPPVLPQFQQHTAQFVDQLQQRPLKSAEETTYEQTVRNFINQQQRPRDSHRSNAYDNDEHHSRSPSHYQREPDYDYGNHKQDRYSSKRKYDDEGRNSGSPEKAQRFNGRLGPHPESSQGPPPRDEKTEQLQKIREETTKSMGLDDDYIKKLEDQKRLREEILRKKAEARRKVAGPTTETSSEIKQHLDAGPSNSATATRPSIYINPKAFKGDLSALNIHKINSTNNNVTDKKTVVRIPASSENASSLNQTSSLAKSVTMGGKVIKRSGIMSSKPKTVMKIVKDKHGNILSRSKVIVVPKLQQDDHTT